MLALCIIGTVLAVTGLVWLFFLDMNVDGLENRISRIERGQVFVDTLVTKKDFEERLKKITSVPKRKQTKK